MSKFFCLVVALLLAVSFAKADERVNVIWSYADFNTPITNKVVTITPLFTVVGGVTNFITGDYKRYTTDTSGNFTVSNLPTGYGYRAALNNAVTTTVTNYFPTNLSGTVYAISNTVVPTNLITGLVAYSMAQSDARFAPIGGGSGGVTNGGGVLAGMLTNATFSASGSNTIAAIVESSTNLNSPVTIRGNAGLGTFGNVLLQGITTQDRSNVVYAVYYDVQDGDTGGYGYGLASHWTVVSDGFVNNESASGTGGDGIQGYLFDVRSLYSTNSDARWAVGSAAGYGPNLKFGSKIETFPLRDMTYSTTANAGQFFYSFMMDGRGGLSFGDNPSNEHLRDWKSNPWIRIRGSSDNTRPQFQLEGTGKPFIGTVTNGAFFNDGTNVLLVQNGVNSPIATLGASNNFTGQLRLNGSPVLTNVSMLEWSVRLPTNIVSTNNFTQTWGLTFTNNGVYDCNLKAVVVGFISTDRPTLFVGCTNTDVRGFMEYNQTLAGSATGGYGSAEINNYGALSNSVVLAKTASGGGDLLDGTRSVLYSRGVSGTQQHLIVNSSIILNVTNAPVTLWTVGRTGTTGTNVLQAGALWRVKQIQ